MDKIYSVCEINSQIKELLDNDEVLSNVLIRGEISNYKLHSSNHHYFSLKDKESVISAVLFKFNARNLNVKLQNGLEILAYGRVSAFVKNGQYQLYVEEILIDGIGDLHKKFEELKQKLYKEGIFDDVNKKPLPRFPEKIAIVTSKTGAVISDMLRILENRYNLCEILVYPVKVQGEGASSEISEAINQINNRNLADVIIIGRGGGSIEDLWAFNEEELAYTIFASNIPIISAVGHEPDITISDFVSDARASTPSNASEIVAPDESAIRGFLEKTDIVLQNFAKNNIKNNKNQLINLENRLKKPINYINDKRLYLDLLTTKLKNPRDKILIYHQKIDTKRLDESYKKIVLKKRENLLRQMTFIDACSPMKVLQRGYSYTVNQDGKVIKNVKQVEIGEEIVTSYHNGEIISKIIEIKEN